MHPQQALAMAALHMAKGEFEQVIAVCDAALRVDPRSVPVLQMKLATLWGPLKRYPDALSVCDYLLSVAGGWDHIEAWQKRGMITAKMGNREEAANAARWILHLAANDERAYELAAALYQSIAREAEVVATYDQGIRYFPRAVDLYEKRGLYLHTVKQYPAALQTYDAALAIEPQRESLWYNRGCTLARLGNAPAAVESLRRAIAMHPSNRKNALIDPDYESLKNDPSFRALTG